MTKITPDHLARSAYVYVRQSTPGQLLNNPESRRRQYALATRAHALGWGNVRAKIGRRTGPHGLRGSRRHGSRHDGGFSRRKTGRDRVLPSTAWQRNNSQDTWGPGRRNRKRRGNIGVGAMPVILRCSRSTHRSGVLPSTPTSLRWPLTVNAIIWRLPGFRSSLRRSISQNGSACESSNRRRRNTHQCRQPA